MAHHTTRKWIWLSGVDAATAAADDVLLMVVADVVAVVAVVDVDGVIVIVNVRIAFKFSFWLLL